jgi:hypothetical protein
LSRAVKKLDRGVKKHVYWYSASLNRQQVDRVEKRQKFNSSEELLEYMSERTDTIMMSFSCGKDSIGAWLACRKHFKRIVPYYLWSIPGMDFVESSLEYYEDYFGTPIIRLPHPSFFRMINGYVFQPPERLKLINAIDFPNYDYKDVARLIREDCGLAPETFTATGVRAGDSLSRWTSVKKHGVVNYKSLTFFPVYDWNNERLKLEIMKARVKLPVDYKLFGRSFDGLDWRFLARVKDKLPADYEKILLYFPLVDLELYRRNFREQWWEKNNALNQ